MLFNSLEYFLFLSLAFIGFWSLARYRFLRVSLLLLSSYVFYMAWNATFIALIIASTLIDYLSGLGLARAKRVVTRKALLAASLFFNLGLLALFKYADFCIDATTQSLALVGVEIAPRYLNLILPVGISFYTFQSLSYTIDVYRRKIRPTKNFLEFATFVAFFPQLVAGPIIRAKELLPQFERTPRLTSRQTGEALFLILSGLIKKVVIADYLAANFLDRVYDDPMAFSSTDVWLALYGYSWQLYGDFSGYTDIARGSAKLFGFELPENFHRPWRSTGPIEFWRTWHVTLGRWVQDYIYIPLGGSRYGRYRTWFNLGACLFVMGLWHGAGWGYVLFAVMITVALLANRIWRDLNNIQGPPSFGAKAVLLACVHQIYFMLIWTVFRPASLDQMHALHAQLLACEVWPISVPVWVWVIFIAMPLVHFSPRRWVDVLQERFCSAPLWAQAAIAIAIGTLIMHVSSQQPAPFVYFQF
jgi:alginate O-acetyltransferase complex protein AlgI